MSGFVIDNSVVMRWLLKDGSRDDLDYAAWVLSAIAGAGIPKTPSIWPFELANVTAMGLRRGLVANDRLAEFLSVLEDVMIEVYSVDVDLAMSGILDLATRQGLSAYDASYLELALRLRLPLATLDKNLRRALREEGGTLFQPGAAP